MTFSTPGVDTPCAGRHLRLIICALLGIWALGLLGASGAAADTPSFVQSAAALGFPQNSEPGGGNWSLYASACETVDTCLAVGEYTDSAGHNQAYVEAITNGIPGTASAVSPPPGYYSDYTYLTATWKRSACSSRARPSMT